jgi:hypothetical protein
MVTILSILAILAGLASFVFFIIVLIKLFQTKGVLHGILGILCGLYTYIWGWMNADTQGLKKTMVNWTIAIVVQIILQITAGVMGGPVIPVEPVIP